MKIMGNSNFRVHEYLQQRPHGLQSLISLLSSPLQEKFADPHSEAVDSAYRIRGRWKKVQNENNIN